MLGEGPRIIPGVLGRRESQDKPTTAGVTLVLKDTLSMKLGQGWVCPRIIPGLLELLCHARDSWYCTWHYWTCVEGGREVWRGNVVTIGHVCGTQR